MTQSIEQARAIVDSCKHALGIYAAGACVECVAHALDEAEARGIAKERRRIADMGYVVWDTGAYPVKSSE